MKRSEKAEIINQTLNKIYKKVPIPLKHRNKFELVIAVLLSAQCTDKRVNQVTPVLFKKANTAIKMIKISKNTIYKIIRPCGLAPQKSKAIFGLSRILVKQFNGKVPESFEELEKLPGVGHKTASVVMSQGFGHAAFPVDTHIHRLAQRWGLTKGKNVTQTEKDLKKLFPKNSWNKLHLQIIFYGREYCQARSCYGIECKICKACNPKRKTKIITKK
ncbi:endonuclease III [Alphaproteobacteria bacterium]|nr:endonuclease III [Alphaproteobacteria bacterium]